MAPLGDGRCLSLPRDGARAEAFGRFHEILEETARILRSIVIETPPNIGGGCGDLWRALATGNRLCKLDTAVSRVKVYSGTHTGPTEYSFTLETAEPLTYAAS